MSFLKNDFLQLPIGEAASIGELEVDVTTGSTGNSIKIELRGEVAINTLLACLLRVVVDTYGHYGELHI